MTHMTFRDPGTFSASPKVAMSHQSVDENTACVLTPKDKRPANSNPCRVDMDVDAAEERSATKANAKVEVNKRTHKQRRKQTEKNPQKTPETTGQSQNKEDFPGKLLGRQNSEATPHIQNKASEVEGTMPMFRGHKPL